ncbi:MAG TPA: pyridoxal phosphate-dependent aminotransferase [Verrucomicrobiae bacterium]|nr:pyridoxal phosphate-dependent aminotransferase [Verrucomicrobiae bacterium]
MFSDRTNWKLSRNKFTQALEKSRASGQPVIDLTVSNPTECGLDYDAEAIQQAFQNSKSLTYEPTSKGLLGARKAVAQYYREDHGETVDSESMVLTTSTSEAYSYIFRLLCNPDDEILVPKPSYPLFEFLADLHDVRLVPYQLQYAHGWFIDFESLQRALTPQTRAVLLVHPNNPTGSYTKAEERERLNRICRHRDLALIVDEVFLDFPLDGQKRQSFVTNSDGLTFTLSGLSKVAGLPQMKVAWLVTSGPTSRTAEAMARLEIIADTYLSLGSPTQWAFSALLEQRKSIQPQIQKRISENWSFLKARLSEADKYELLETEGGWNAVIRVKRGNAEKWQGDEEFAIELMQSRQLIVHPGHFYDFSCEGQFVTSLITPVNDFRHGMEALLSRRRL